MNIREELDTLIRARYPIIYVVSWEEARVEEVVLEVAAKRQKRVFEWSCTTGLVPAGGPVPVGRQVHAATRDPLAALEEVLEHVDPALFLFKDLHPFLDRSHPAVVRRLKEVAHQLKHGPKTLILVSPTVEIPTELEKEITLLSVPLPEREDLDDLLGRIAEEVRGQPQVSVDLDAAGRERLLTAALGLTLGEAENVFARILVRERRLSADHVRLVFGEKQQIIRKNGLLEYCASDETLEEVGGVEALKDWLRKRTSAFSDEARAFGLPAPKGVLLLGVQGCGKSLCAKAVASLWQLPLLRFDVGRVFGSYMGSSEENVRRAIGVAESVAPAILWVDEIDKAFSGTRGSGLSDGGTTARVFGTLLTWLSEKQAPVFVVATANEISQLPAELLRKGRLDEIFFIDLPAAAEREEILAIHLRRRQRDPARFDIGGLGAVTEGFSGAELEQGVIAALYDAFYERAELTTPHLLRAIRETVPLVRTMEEQVAELRAWAVGRARPAGRIGT